MSKYYNPTKEVQNVCCPTKELAKEVYKDYRGKATLEQMLTRYGSSLWMRVNSASNAEFGPVHTSSFRNTITAEEYLKIDKKRIEKKSKSKKRKFYF